MRFDQHIEDIEKSIGYTFTDKSLLRQAFTRTSFCNENKGLAGEGYQSNELLEFIGDSVLSAAIVTLFVGHFTHRYAHGISSALTEKEGSNIKSKLSDKKNLSDSMRKLGLQTYLIMGEGDEKLGIFNEPSVMEDLFESIIAAVYLDCGMEMKTVTGVVETMLCVQNGWDDPAVVMQSFKNALQEFCADKQRRLPPPRYEKIGDFGPEHEKTFTYGCYVGDELYGVGEGKNKTVCENRAAEAALSRLKKEESARAPLYAGETVSDTPKSRLNETAVKEGFPAPVYQTEQTQKDGAPFFTATLTYRHMTVRADGRSKRAAEQAAARKMLEKIGRPFS